MPVWVGVPLSHATECALKSRADMLKAANISPDIITTCEVPDPIVKIHVDFLDETTHEEYRASMKAWRLLLRYWFH
jgi:hypothetical protein